MPIEMLLDTVGRLLTAKFLPNPIFVVGTGRSGTSVLLQALGRHPKILSLSGEAPFLTSIGGEAALFQSRETGEYYRSCLKTDLGYLHGTLGRLGFEVSAGRHYGLKTVARAWWRDRSPPWAKTFWCAKTFPPRVVSEGLSAVYPGARFVYIVRNGLDVVHSMTRYHGFSRESFETHCRNWASGAAAYRHLAECPAGIKVRHEELIDDPEALFRRICAFLGIADAPQSARFVRTTLVHPLDQGSRQVGEVKAVLRARRPATRIGTPNSGNCSRRSAAR
jgi:hypothetical protein